MLNAHDSIPRFIRVLATRLGVALAALALIAAACGNGSESAAPEPAPPAPAPAPAEPEPAPPAPEPPPTTAGESAPASSPPDPPPETASTTTTEAVPPVETTTTTTEEPSAARAAISANGHHSCVVVSEAGEVYCWGSNDAGQLGSGEIGADQQSAKPLKAVGVSDAVSVATGWEHSCAVHRSGKVSCWGDNNRGELGDGVVESVALDPVGVIGIDDALDADAGNWHTCAVHRSGQVSCWGWNADGQLGNGASEVLSPTPVRVDGISDAVAVALGSEHSCALHATGEISCWGDNFFGELGTGTAGPDERSLTPQKVVGISDAVAVDTTIEHSCAVHETGTISCWGANSNGQLGNNSSESVSVPQQVIGIDDAVDVSVGAGFSCAVRQDGTVFCWGSNTLGALGNGEQDPFDPDSSFWGSMSPLQVLGISDVVDISSGRWFTCALTEGGDAYCWGSNLYGELGAGIVSSTESAPVQVAGIDEAVAVISAPTHSCVVHATGKVTCWGDYWRGDLGDVKAAETSEVRPVQIVGLDDAVAVNADEGLSCALQESGTVVCWGAMIGGSAYVLAEDGGVSPTLTASTFRTDVTKVAVGGWSHVCFLHENGEVACAGSNDLGQIGNKSVVSFTLLAQPATGITDAIDLAVGDSHTCVVHEGGQVSCWGSNFFGQLGNGEEGAGSEQFEPVRVPGIEDAEAIAASHFNTCVLHEGGEVSCWGGNWADQLGASAPVGDDHSSVPVRIPDIVDAVEVSVGLSSMCVLDSDGEVSCWGSNHSSELGTMSPMPDDQTGTPLKVEGVENVASISVGAWHVCVVHTDGSVTCWGSNVTGQLGSGSIPENASSYEPVRVDLVLSS